MDIYRITMCERGMAVSKKKKLLIYADYYIPDMASTGQILRELAEGMLDVFDITVVCTVPCYTGVIEDKYKTKNFYKEKRNGVRVIRIRVPEFAKSNKISRVKNIAAYYFGARKLTRMLKSEKFDYVYTISLPPLLGGLLGVYGKKKLRTADGHHPKLIYNIQDFNPEQIKAIGYFRNKPMLNVMMAIDKYSCRKSDLIITVGHDLVETIENRFAGEKIPTTVMINNWIDEKEIYPLPSSDPRVMDFCKKYGLENKYVIMYSGNIGLYYDLENLIKVIGKFKDAKTPDNKEVVFAFVGAGGVLNKLMSYQRKHELSNVVFIPYQDKKELVYSLNAGDVHWCVSAKGIKGVSCPSKYYGIAAVGKPILGVLESGSEIRMLVEKTKGGLVCDPIDYEAVEKNIAWFISHADSEEIAEMGKRGYNYLLKNLTKDVSISKYKDVIKKM